MTCEEGSQELRPCVCTRVCEEPPAPRCPGCEGCRGYGGSRVGQLRDGFIPIPRTGPPARLPLKVAAVSPPGRAGPCATRAGWGPGAGSGARARERHRELSRAWQRAHRVLCQAQSLALAGTEVSASSPSSTLLMGNARPRTGHPSPGVVAGPGEGRGAGTPRRGGRCCGAARAGTGSPGARPQVLPQPRGSGAGGQDPGPAAPPGPPTATAELPGLRRAQQGRGRKERRERNSQPLREGCFKRSASAWLYLRHRRFINTIRIAQAIIW